MTQNNKPSPNQALQRPRQDVAKNPALTRPNINSNKPVDLTDPKEKLSRPPHPKLSPEDQVALHQAVRDLAALLIEKPTKEYAELPGQEDYQWKAQKISPVDVWQNSIATDVNRKRDKTADERQTIDGAANLPEMRTKLLSIQRSITDIQAKIDSFKRFIRPEDLEAATGKLRENLITLDRERRQLETSISNLKNTEDAAENYHRMGEVGDTGETVIWNTVLPEAMKKNRGLVAALRMPRFSMADSTGTDIVCVVFKGDEFKDKDIEALKLLCGLLCNKNNIFNQHEMTLSRMVLDLLKTEDQDQDYSLKVLDQDDIIISESNRFDSQKTGIDSLAGPQNPEMLKKLFHYLQKRFSFRGIDVKYSRQAYIKRQAARGKMTNLNILEASYNNGNLNKEKSAENLLQMIGL